MSKNDFVALLQQKQELKKQLHGDMKHVLEMEKVIFSASDASQLSSEVRATLQAAGLGLYIKVKAGDLTV